MKKIKILMIAPYEGLFEMANSIKRERQDLIIDVMDGNLEDGALIAQKMQAKGYDAIISRGGTALEIEKIAEIPVFDIEFSAYDMIRILRMVDYVSMKEAIVGFPSIAKCARIVSELLGKDICVQTINSEEEVIDVLKQLREEQYNFIIGDQIVHNIAKKLNMSSTLRMNPTAARTEWETPT